jgi:CIC family chloride channel protein
VSALFVQVLSAGKRIFRALKLPPGIAMAAGGALVGAIAIGLPEVAGNGFEATDRILHGNPTIVFLLLLFAGKMVATSATIGSGGVGGVFTPSLLVGATIGGLVARLCHAAAPGFDAPVGGYALLGMGGMLAGMTRAPLLAVIMIFELTQNTAVLLPMMVVSVLAVTMARVLQKESMYIASLRSAGIVWEKTPEATGLASLKVADIMRRDVALVPRTMPLPEIVSAFLRSRSLFLYVGDEKGRLEGVVDIHNIKESFHERELSGLILAEDLLTEVPFATPTEPLTSVNEKLWFRDVGQIPVVDGPDTRLFLGIVTQRDLLGAFDSEVLKHKHLLARVRTVGETSEIGYLELPEKHRVAEIPMPRALEGRTIAETALRSRYGVSVLAIKRYARDGSERRFVPEPADRFAAGDVLVVLGSDDALARLRKGEPLPVLTPA